MRQRCEFPGSLPGLNDIINWAKSHGGNKGPRGQRWGRYSAIKKGWTGVLADRARQHLSPISSAYFTYLLVEPSRKRDRSNIRAGAVKLIEDALQEAKILENDGWKQVLDFRCHEVTCAELGVACSRVVLYTDSERTLERSEVLQLESERD